MIKNIVFDVGRVLVDFEPDRVMKEHGFDKDTCEQINKIMFHSPLWNEFDRSVLDAEQILNKFLELLPEKKEQICEIFSHLNEMIKVRDYVCPWITDLKERGYRLYVLSNYAEYTYECTREDLNQFLPYMDGVVFSFQCNLVKPEKAIYQRLLEEYKIKPEETVFLDDREENIEAALNVGMHGIVFKDYEQGKAELEKMFTKEGER